MKNRLSQFVRVHFGKMGLTMLALVCVTSTVLPERIQQEILYRLDTPRNLSDQQIAQIQAAINAISGGPPMSFSWNGGNGTQTAYGAVIGVELSIQLATGRMDAKPMGQGEYATASIDLTESSFNDQMTLSSNKLNEWNSPENQKYLCETLIHEWEHKKQTAANHPTDAARELDAYRCEFAYKNAIGMGYDDPEFRFVASQDIAYMEKRIAEIGEEDSNVRPSWSSFGNGSEYYILFDSNLVGGIDSLIGFQFGELEWSAYPFGHRASDMILYDESPLVPPGHTLAIICGGFPMTGESGYFPYDLHDGEVMGMLPPRIFAPPMYPPTYFYSMTRGEDPAIQFVLDTLGHTIQVLIDFDIDGLPETILGEFANAAMPGFEILNTARGIDYVSSPWMGSGLLVNTNDVHMPAHHSLSELCWFLPDNDFNHIADACLVTPLWAFEEVLPVAGGNVPWAGDEGVALYASWQHNIAVLATDSLGDLVFDELGSMLMLDNVHAVCPIARPLIAGEFILANDLTNGERLRLAIKVVDPAIDDLTISFGDGLLRLDWGDVPGAGQYELLESVDGSEYVPTGIFSLMSELELGPPTAVIMHYEVAARR